MKVKIVTGYEGKCLYKDIIISNLQQYCNRHGYELVTQFENWQPSNRHIYWRKIELIKREIIDCDLLLWLDADCLITDLTIRLEDIIDDSHDVYLTCESDGVQAGVMLFRNSTYANQLLKDLWDIGSNKEHQLWDLSDNAILRSMVYTGYSIDRMKLFDKREFACKNVHFNWGQFIVHCPGCEEWEKLEMLKYFSTQVIEEEEPKIKHRTQLGGLLQHYRKFGASTIHIGNDIEFVKQMTDWGIVWNNGSINQMSDDYLDLIYLDGDLTYEGISRYLKILIPKLKIGGIMAGHDYLSREYGVYPAVQNFTKDKYKVNIIPEHSNDNASFWFRKT